MGKNKLRHQAGCETPDCLGIQQGQCDCGDNLCEECLDVHFANGCDDSPSNAAELAAMEEMGDERDPEDLP